MKKQNTTKAETTTEAKTKTKAEIKAEEVAARKAAAEAKKQTKAAAENVGTAKTAAEKLAIASKLENLSTTGKAVLASYMDGNTKATGKAAILAAGGRADDVKDDVGDYAAAVLALYAAAVNEADQHNAATSEALFTAWKAYLKGLITSGKLPASGQDGHRLYKAVTAVKTEAKDYAAYQRKDGTNATHMAGGVRHEAVVSLSTFQKAAERLAAERLADLDGVISYNAGKAVTKANREKKEALLSTLDPVQIVKKAS